MSFARSSSRSLPILVCLGAVAASGCLSGGLAPADGGAGDAPVSASSASTAASSGAGDAAAGAPATSVPLASGGASSTAASGDAGASSPASATTGAATATASAPASALDAGADAHHGSGYQIDLSETRVTGFSSGAFFAVQFHVAFSSIVKGAGIFAGGPYDCAQGSANAAETTCLTGSPDVSALVAATKTNYASGAIDDPTNLASERVYIFGGADDSVVHPSVVDALDSYYGAFMSSSSIQYESRHAGASHTMPTMSYGGDCDSVQSPYVGDCSYDGAGTAMQQIYGTLTPAATTLSGTILSFSQANFVADPASKGLAATGYYYVPASCAAGAPCRVLVAFHGCEQNAALVGDAYYGHAGFNEWADTNGIIVLYPQATSSSGNDYECWDFWGYDGASYATQSGTQLAAVRAMLGWLADGGASSGAASGTTDAGGAGSTGTVGLDAGVSGFTGLLDAGACVTASNTAQVAAGRAYALGGMAYAKGSGELLGADNASTQSSLVETASGYYSLCL